MVGGLLRRYRGDIVDLSHLYIMDTMVRGREAAGLAACEATLTYSCALNRASML